MNLVERAKNILLNPKGEWEVIKNEEHSISDLFTKYAMILAAIPAIAGLIGFSMTGFSFMTNIKWLIAMYISSLVGVYVIAFIIDVLAPSFGSTKNMEASLKVVVFAYTASWVGGIFNIIPALSWISAIAGIYSLVLLYMGLERVKNVPKEKMVGYFIVTLVIAIVVSIVSGVIISTIAFGGMLMTP